MRASRSVGLRGRRLARTFLTVTLAFAAAKAISLAQTIIIAGTLGLSTEMDAFAVANAVPELIFTLIAGGALAHAFIPVFSGFLARDDRNGAWHVASLVINTVFLVTLLLGALAFVSAPWLVTTLLAPGFGPATQVQTIALMRILLLTTLIFSVSGISMGILQSHNHFLLPALAPILFDVGILAGVLFLIHPLGVYGIAWGAVLGAILHFAIQWPGLLRYRARWWPILRLRDPTLWRIIRLMLPRVAGLGVFSLNFLVMNSIASRLGAGSVAALAWGWRMMQIPQTLIGTAMGTVIFPTLAALSELKDLEGRRDALSTALRLILIASIPAAIGLIALGQPLISLLERGAFDSQASLLVYSTLRFFALGMVVHSVLEVVARSFYAGGDTLTPLWAALAGAALNLAGSYLLSGVLLLPEAGPATPGLPLRSLDLGVSGLALANTLGTGVEVGILLWLLRRRWQGIRESELARVLLKTLAASLLMALAIVPLDALLAQFMPEAPGLAWQLLRAGIGALAGILVFLGSALALRMRELRELVALLPGKRVTESRP